MILMQANPFRGPLELVGTENRDFPGPWNGNERSKCHLSPNKLRFQGPPLQSFNGPSNGFAPIKIIKSKCRTKKQVHWLFYVHEFCCSCVMRANPFQWPSKWQGLKKYRFSGHTPSNGPRNGCCLHQNHYVPRHTYKQQVPGTLIVTFVH